MPCQAQCFCGKTALQFVAARPECASECCCCDCRNALAWTRNYQRSDDASPPEEEEEENNKEKPEQCYPATLQYVDNDIVSVKGEEHLQLMWLRSSSATLRVVSNCCGSILANVHYAYFHRRVMILTDACQFTYDDQTTDPVLPYARFQTKYWDSYATQPLSDIPPLRTGGPSFPCDEPTWLFSTGLFQKVVLNNVPSKWQGEQVQTLIRRLRRAAAGRHPPLVLDVPETILPAHFRTGLGMFSLTLRNPFATQSSQQ